MLCCYRDGYLPRYPQGSTCPCVTGYFWALVTDGVAIHPKHAEDVAGREKNREKERYKERERERRRYIYMFLLLVEEPPPLEYLFTSPNDKSIHRFINQSITQSPPSKIMNFLILIATALFTTLVSCDVRIPILPPPLLLPPHHTPIISISHKKTADYPSLTPKPIFSTTGMHGRHRRSRPWKWNLLPRNCRKWNRSDL